MKKHFVTGLILIAPVVLTLLILGILLRLLTRPFEGIAFALLDHFHLLNGGTVFFSSDQLLIFFSRFLILLSLFGITLLMGYVARWVFIHETIKFSDWVFHRIPLVNKIYRASQETVTTIFNKNSRSFRQVVLVPFPHSPALSIGLVTSDGMPQDSNEGFRDLISVFVPGTPNPTVGFLLLYRPDQLIPVKMTVEEGLKYVISCGVMLPGATKQ